jgi:hypothetical protein
VHMPFICIKENQALGKLVVVTKQGYQTISEQGQTCFD